MSKGRAICIIFDVWYNEGVGFSMTIEEGEMEEQTERERFTDKAEDLLDNTSYQDGEQRRLMIEEAAVYAALANAAAMSDVAAAISEVAGETDELRRTLDNRLDPLEIHASGQIYGK